MEISNCAPAGVGSFIVLNSFRLPLPHKLFLRNDPIALGAIQIKPDSRRCLGCGYVGRSSSISRVVPEPSSRRTSYP